MWTWWLYFLLSEMSLLFILKYWFCDFKLQKYTFLYYKTIFYINFIIYRLNIDLSKKLFYIPFKKLFIFIYELRVSIIFQCYVSHHPKSCFFNWADYHPSIKEKYVVCKCGYTIRKSTRSKTTCTGFEKFLCICIHILQITYFVFF